MDFALRPVEPTVGLHHSSARSSVDIGPEDTGQVGQFTSIDVATGATRWTHRQRAGIGGSVLTTAGGLVFVSDDARRFRAFDAENGEILWEQILNATAGGFPVSYSVDGVRASTIGDTRRRFANAPAATLCMYSDCRRAERDLMKLERATRVELATTSLGS